MGHIIRLTIANDQNVITCDLKMQKEEMAELLAMGVSASQHAEGLEDLITDEGAYGLFSDLRECKTQHA